MTDTLVLSFQTRLSAVMETLLKTTMYEVTRLVEESFLEQMDRGKRESEVLKRRLIVSEAKLRERERFKRVRCVDCGRTAVSRRRVLHRGPEAQSSLDHPLVVKQENASDNSWSCSPKGNTNQEKPLTTQLETKHAVQVGEHKPGGEVKEETTEARDTQACLVIHSQIHEQKDPQSSVEETNGLHNTDRDHKPGGTSCTERPGDEDVRHRNPPKWFDSKIEPSARSSVSQPEPVRTSVSSESPGLRPQSAGTEDRKLDCILKEEALYVTAGNKELQDGWTLDTEGAEATDFSAHGYIEQELQQIQEDWSSGLEQNADSETYANIIDVQGLPYRTRYDAEGLASYSVHELDMGGDQGEKTQDTLGHAVSVAVGTDQKDLDIVEEGGRRYSSSIRSKSGNRGSLPAQVNPETEDVDRDMHCLFINADGHLQDTSALTEVRSGIAEGAGHKGHSLYAGDTASGSLYKGHALNHSLKTNVGQALGDSRASVKGYPVSHRVVSTAAYTCNQCGKKFTQACNLKLHQRVHQQDGLHSCNHCGKGYSSFSDLRRHRCSQTGDKPFTCMLCGNKFSRLWNLKLHQRIHTQEKPHKCTMCSKSFTRADILKVHQRTHTGERPYCCAICGLSFKRMHHLRSHQRKHSADLNNQ